MLAFWLVLACGRLETRSIDAPPAVVVPSPPPTAVAAEGPAGLDRFAGSRVFAGPMPTAAIVVLHGSEGGGAPYAAQLAEALSQRGLVTASLCWFACEGLSPAIHDVPLDRTVDFLEWFADGPAAGLPVTVYGASRGAEHVLLLASLLGDTSLMDGVAVHAGSDTVVAAYDPATQDVITGDGGYEAAWTWHGERLYGERALPYGSGPPIAIEDYPGPLFLSHGDRDPLWPAERSRRLAARRAGDPALKTELEVWEGEGHVLQSSAHRAAFMAALEAFAKGVAAR